MLPSSVNTQRLHVATGVLMLDEWKLKSLCADGQNARSLEIGNRYIGAGLWELGFVISDKIVSRLELRYCTLHCDLSH